MALTEGQAAMTTARDLAKRHEVRRSMPEQHACCYAARRHLVPQFDGDAWVWKVRAWIFMPLAGKPGVALPQISYCPWCGEKLPDRGRLQTEEVENG